MENSNKIAYTDSIAQARLKIAEQNIKALCPDDNCRDKYKEEASTQKLRIINISCYFVWLHKVELLTID